MDWKESLALGKATDYVSTYTPSLLQAVPRQYNREHLGISANNLPFKGHDLWHGYEVSWLNNKGKPQVALLKLTVPCDTPNIVESKSFKLYLNSLNQSRFGSVEQVSECIAADIQQVVGGAVTVILGPVHDTRWQSYPNIVGCCLDGLDIEVDAYQYEPGLLKRGVEKVSEVLYSHLFKSNCLVTHQPDWATVVIDYQGTEIDHESLLRYLISYRMHNEFHEQCVERIYSDIMQRLKPEYLMVQALFTRRGGLDICPVRASALDFSPMSRQIRQ